MNFLLNGIRGNRVRHDNPCEIEIGDVVSVECDMLLKRYGIWTGEKFILYGEDRWGKHSVHEETFGNFMRGAEHFAVWCKTGIAESHELQSLQKVLNRFIVY